MQVKLGKKKVVSKKWRKNNSGMRKGVKLGKKKVISNKWRINNPGKRGSKST